MEPYISFEKAKNKCAKELLYYLYSNNKLENFDFNELILYLYEYTTNMYDIHWSFRFITNVLDCIILMDKLLFPNEKQFVYVSTKSNMALKIYHKKNHKLYIDRVNYFQVSKKLADKAGYRMCKICERMV